MKFYLFSWHGIVSWLSFSEEEVKQQIESGFLKKINWHFVLEQDLAAENNHQIKTLEDLKAAKERYHHAHPVSAVCRLQEKTV